MEPLFMKATQPRIPAIPIERLSAQQRSLIGAWTELNYSRVIVNHTDIYSVYIPFLAQLVERSKLPPRERELVCLRILTLCGEIYELNHHKTIARNAGMSEDEIAAACGGDGECLSSFERAVLRATEELHREQNISDATWKELSTRYSDVQRMDLVFLAGCYVMMAMTTKTFGVEPEASQEQLQRINAVRDYV
jgi:alkylhydroperoxidase family enzyme